MQLIAPLLRGDDVEALQVRLGRLGFDCGRVDGVFGSGTAAALTQFQRNCGLEVDGVCGPLTVRALEVNGARTGSGPGVATLRELEQLSSIGTALRELRLVIGHFGGLGPLTRQIARGLRHHGAKVITVDELDPSVHATASNNHVANAYIGFRAQAHDAAGVTFYATPGFESRGGRALATRISVALRTVAGLVPAETDGGQLQVLRETRMTAVVCSLGPVQRVVDAAPAITEAVGDALASWATSPATAAS
ncbi:MAG: peptidoglycan-binding protein [Ilumatobacteraceae bacterium]